MERCALRLPGRPREGGPVLRRARQRGRHAEVARDRSGLHLGRRSPAAHAVARHGHLRAAREGFTMQHPEVPPELRGTYAGLCHRARHRAPAAPGRDRGRADAGARLRGRPPPARQGPDATTGATTRIGFFAPDMRYSATGPHQRIQDDGEDAALRRHRGDSRRGLQPHGRRQSAGTDAVLPRHRQRLLLPADPRRPALLHGLHRLRQHPQHAAPARAAADHGLAALLGAGDARRRLPLRPRLRARARAVRRRPAGLVLRHHRPGSGALAGEADRRAVGRGRRRLPGRQFPARAGPSGTTSTATPCAPTGKATAG